MASLPLQVATGILCASYWRGSWYVLDHTLFPNERMKSGIVSLTAGSALLGMKQYILSPSFNGTKILVRMLPPPKSVSLRTRYVRVNRFVVMYGIATACVLIWRGTWLLWDEAGHRFADAYYSYERRRSLESCVAVSAIQDKPQQQSQQQPHSAIDHNAESTVTQHDDIDEKVLFYSGILSHVVATVGLLFMGRFASVMAPPANVTMLRDNFIHGKGKVFARAAKSFAGTPSAGWR